MKRVFAVVLMFASCVMAADDYDVVVYGGTSAGVIGGVAAARAGRSVVLIEPSKHLGGMTSGGAGGDGHRQPAIDRRHHPRVLPPHSCALP
jgi:flavin-dependent dehydrogenase